ncbi:MAG: hypothetical protein JWP19_449 [Rhodoglobus sp.]|nr:hypothetical protein [Rhodoglobus sp.]
MPNYALYAAKPSATAPGEDDPRTSVIMIGGGLRAPSIHYGSSGTYLPVKEQ